MIMEELLHHLEQRIKQLIDQHDRLKHNNQQLNQGKFMLAREKEALLAKQQKAAAQIENLVSMLKTIENQHDR